MTGFFLVNFKAILEGLGKNLVMSRLTGAPASARRPACKTRPERQAAAAHDTGKARPDSESGDPRQGQMPAGPATELARVGGGRVGGGHDPLAWPRPGLTRATRTGSLSIFKFDYPRERFVPPWVALLFLQLLFESSLSSSAPPVMISPLHLCLNARVWAPLPPAITPPLAGVTQTRI